MSINISVIVLAKNNENTIKETLNSLVDFNDVVVYDNGSTDETINIVNSFNNTNLIFGEFKGFGWTRNKAATYAKNEWILIIDSDEVVDDILLNELKKKELNNKFVYRINSKGFYKNIQVKHCGWTLTVKRLYNIKTTSYNNNEVHEEIISENLKEEVLTGSINHYSYHSISEFIIKADKYSTLFAKNNVGKRKSSPLKAFFNSLYSFIRTYIIKQGFRDGYIGLIISFSHAVTNFYKYIKLYELNKELKK